MCPSVDTESRSRDLPYEKKKKRAATRRDQRRKIEIDDGIKYLVISSAACLYVDSRDNSVPNKGRKKFAMKVEKLRRAKFRRDTMATQSNWQVNYDRRRRSARAGGSF